MKGLALTVLKSLTVRRNSVATFVALCIALWFASAGCMLAECSADVTSVITQAQDSGKFYDSCFPRFVTSLSLQDLVSLYEQITDHETRMREFKQSLPKKGTKDTASGTYLRLLIELNIEKARFLRYAIESQVNSLGKEFPFNKLNYNDAYTTRTEFKPSVYTAKVAGVLTVMGFLAGLVALIALRVYFPKPD